MKSNKEKEIRQPFQNTKQIMVTVPIDYWRQLRLMQKDEPFEGWPLTRIASQLVIKSLDDERLSRKYVFKKREKTFEDEIHVTDIGINIDVLSKEDKPENR